MPLSLSSCDRWSTAELRNRLAKEAAMALPGVVSGSSAESAPPFTLPLALALLADEVAVTPGLDVVSCRLGGHPEAARQARKQLRRCGRREAEAASIRKEASRNMRDQAGCARATVLMCSDEAAMTEAALQSDGTACEAEKMKISKHCSRHCSIATVP